MIVDQQDSERGLCVFGGGSDRNMLYSWSIFFCSKWVSTGDLTAAPLAAVELSGAHTPGKTHQSGFKQDEQKHTGQRLF